MASGCVSAVYTKVNLLDHCDLRALYFDQPRRMGVADCQRQLATLGGKTYTGLAGVKPIANLVIIRLTAGFKDIICPMNPLIELDQLGLDPASQTQVAAMIQSLLDQANHQASEQLQAKGVERQIAQAALQARLNVKTLKSRP